MQFSRLRPANFPTLRMAQLAALYAYYGTLFQRIIEQKTVKDTFALFTTQPSSYWNTHYNFGVENPSKPKKNSRYFIDLIAINTLMPMRFAYQRYLGNSGEETLFQWAENLPLEKNKNIKTFEKMGLPLVHSGSGQAVLHLYKNYCKKRSCLSCQVGVYLMKSN